MVPDPDDVPESAASPRDGASAATPASTIAPEPLAPGQGGKLYRTRLVRSDAHLYYIAKGDVWAVRRIKPGEPKAPAEQVTHLGFAMDIAHYLYYLDSDGDIARKPRE